MDIGYLDDKRWKREEDDFQIEEHRFASRVLDVETNHFSESGPVFSRNLPEARKTRNGLETLTLMGRELLVLVRDAGARSDDAHVSPENINDLGKLVETGGAKEPATWDEP